MERERGHISIPPIGATSLLTVFAVLCLTMFALLTLSDVRSDARLADASLESTRAYYAADARAQEILARLRSGEDVAEAGETKIKVIHDGAQPSGQYYEYAVPISDTLELQVLVAVEGRDYQVLRWQAVSTTEWDEEIGLEVWTPE